MNKVIYVSFLDESKLAGYKYKIHSQCHAIRNIGLEVYLLIISKNDVIFYKFDKEEKVIFRKKNNRKRISKNRNIFDELFLFKYFISELNRVVQEIKPDFIYVRRILPITPLLIKTIKKYKKNGIKICYEYPTYPWEKELLAEKRFLLYFLDKLQFKFLKKAVNQLVIVGADEKKFISPSEKVISNAISLEAIPIVDRDKASKINEINMIGVANVNLFHGFDRLIYGLENYYKISKEVKVTFHIVGKLSKGLNLKKLVDDLNLNDYVKFHGQREGQALDDIFNNMHIGVGFLGAHRKNVDTMNSLKNREYAARGLPFIFSERDDVIEKQNPPFILKESFDDEPINVDEVVRFYTNLKVEATEIRAFAKKYLNWEVEMKKVFTKRESKFMK